MSWFRRRTEAAQQDGFAWINTIRCDHVCVVCDYLDMLTGFNEPNSTLPRSAAATRMEHLDRLDSACRREPVHRLVKP